MKSFLIDFVHIDIEIRKAETSLHFLNKKQKYSVGLFVLVVMPNYRIDAKYMIKAFLTTYQLLLSG